MMKYKVTKRFKDSLIQIVLWLFGLLLILVAYNWTVKSLQMAETERLWERNAKECLKSVNEFMSENLKQLKYLSDQKFVLSVLEGGKDFEEKEIIEILNTSVRILDASMIYIMDREGFVVASSEYKPGKTIVGGNYGFRPYFKKAIMGKSNIYPTVGSVTKNYGIYFSRPVYSGETIVGVAVLKIPSHKIEVLLKKYSVPAMLTTPEGVIFATNKGSELFKSIKEIPSTTKKEIKKQQQFGKREVKPTKMTSEIFRYNKISKELLFPEWQLIMMFPVNQLLPLQKLEKQLLVFSFIATSILMTLLVIFIMDIRLRKLDEKNLVDLSNYLQAVVDSMPSAMVGIDRTGRIVSMNSIAEVHAGVKLEEVQGRAVVSVFNFLGSDFREMLSELWDEEVLVLNNLHYNKNGHGWMAHVTAYVLQEESRGAVVLIESVMDRG
jgi:two-component system, NtrC family, C4-dicarboxylate transport sensor histidine kinase DctB